MAERGTGGPVSRVALGLVCLALAATTGCVALPETKTGRTPDWTPVSQKAALTFMKRYDAVHNKASKGRDASLISSVESGPLLRASQAEFRIAKRLDPQDKKPAEPVTHADPRVSLPTFDGYPVWFVAVSTVAEEGRTSLDLVMRPSAGSLWKKAQTVTLDEGVQLPALADRDGSAVAVTPGPADGLVRPPDKTAAAYANLLAGGRRSPAAKAFAPHPDTERSHRATEQNKSQSSAFTYEQEFEVTSVRSLATADGGALVLFTMAESEGLAMRNASLKFEKDDAVAAYTGLAEGKTFLRTSWVWQVAALVPAKGQGNGQVRIIGTDRSLASAQMR